MREIEKTRDKVPVPVSQKKTSRVKQVFKVLSIVMGVMILSIAGVLGGLYLTYKTTLDAARADALAKERAINDTTFRRAGSTIILDKDNQQLAKISLSTYKYLSLSEVSNYVSQGYIAIEDKNFLAEGGIDFKGTLKAAVLYLKNGGKATVGGSTITQQVAKNVFLTQDRTLSRKLTEIFLAIELAKRYSKSQILEFYVNNCYYGEGCYGIESASQYFFAKSASKLSLAEAATLCGLSNNPSLYNPIVNPEKTTLRRNIILGEMLVQAKITQAEYDKAKHTVLTLTLQKPIVTSENYMTSYAIDCTARALMEQDGFQFQYLFKTEAERKNYTTKYKEAYFQRDKDIRSGGYTICTSLDPTKQGLLQASLDEGLSDFTSINPANDKYSMQGAAVSIDNKTGYVVAIVGGRGNTDIFNRAFLSFRQPGSSIKPVLNYAPAFELGYHPMSQITDQYIPDGPKNDQNMFFGPVTIRYATELSLNTVAYQVLTKIKPITGLAYLENMNYAGLYPEDNNPIASIGGFTLGVSPVEQAGGYYALVNGGYFTQPSCVISVDYLEQSTVYQNPRAGKQVYSPEAAYMMTDILKGVISTDYGTGHKLKIEGQIVAGKTGTTEESKDGWFCGFSAYYTTVVWSGYDIPTAVDDLYGSSYPGHIWLDYMTKIHAELPELDFPKPPGIVFKNIDAYGNPTDLATGRLDMFSEHSLEKTETQQQVNEGTMPKPKTMIPVRHTQEEEIQREQEADAIIAILESLSTQSPQETIESVYLEAKLRIAIVNDDDKYLSYVSRIRAVQKTLGLSGAY